MGKAVAVDLDGCLAKYDVWEGLEEIGDPYSGAAEFLEAIQTELELEVVLHTTRSNPDPFNEGEERATTEELEALLWGWLQEHELEEFVDRIHLGPGKPIAVAYVDDRAVPCMPGEHGGTLVRPEAEFHKAFYFIKSMVEEVG